MSHLPPTEKEKFTYGLLMIPVTSTSQKIGGKRICFSFIGQDLKRTPVLVGTLTTDSNSNTLTKLQELVRFGGKKKT